ncbi:MAG: nodulation protein NodH, partial [Pseudomonadota bacterium]
MNRPRYFAILGAMRTGSNLLERTLAGCEGLVALGELFNPAFLGRPGRTEGFGATLAERDRDPIGFLEKAIAAHPGDVPGFRLFGGHDPRVIDHVARDPDCARIVLTRDPLQSFLSLAIARETGQWMLGARENRRLAKVAFDGAAFEAYRGRLEDHYGRIRRATRAAGLTAFDIDYEELGELPIVAGAARHAGARAAMTRLDHPIARQNPPDPAHKVTNPEALAPYLAGPSPARAGPAAPPPRFEARDELRVAPGAGALYAPLPGARDD